MAERTKFSMQWHITDRCDQRCKHCYIYEGKDKKCGLELDLDTLKAILEDFLQTCDKLERDPFSARDTSKRDASALLKLMCAVDTTHSKFIFVLTTRRTARCA